MSPTSSSPEHPSPTAVLDVPAESQTSRKKKTDWVRRAFFIVLTLLLVILIAVGLYLWNLASTFNSAERIDEVFPTGERPAAVEGAQTILLLGSDTRSGLDDNAGLADTIMVAYVPADQSTVSVMSIMRDNWVEIPGHGEAKINAAMAWGGVPLIVETVESIIDIPIDHVAIIDFEGFEGITSALGGVTVNNPRAFTAVSGETFAEGEITLEGSDALAFVRERKAFATGDYERATNQQLFLKSLIGEVLSADTLTNPVRINELVGSLTPYVQVDQGMDAGYLAGLAWSLRDVRSGDIDFFTMPTLGTGTIAGQSVVLPDWDQIEVIRQALKDGTIDAYEAP